MVDGRGVNATMGISSWRACHGANRGRSSRPRGFADLEDSPPPRFDLIDLDSYAGHGPTVLPRAAPFDCEFCEITLMLGRRVRTKNPRANLEMNCRSWYDLGWRGNVFFVDDNFIGSPPKAKQLLKELIIFFLPPLSFQAP